VDAIAAYIARDSAHYAAAVVRRILTSTRQLGEHPWSGRIVPELEDPTIREILVYSYRIVYRVQDQVVTVSAVGAVRPSIEPIHFRRRLGTRILHVYPKRRSRAEETHNYSGRGGV
jgi:toxin ParE1/3/4